MKTKTVEPITRVRADCADFEQSSAREWLVGNGLGGFACGTVSGALTRRYHGLLVAALAPPVQRTVLVAKLDLRARYGGRDHALACNEFADGTVNPQGHRLIESFTLDGSMPVWRHALDDALLEQRVWMEHGRAGRRPLHQDAPELGRARPVGLRRHRRAAQDGDPLQR